jgi:hypothetical protein
VVASTTAQLEGALRAYVGLHSDAVPGWPSTRAVAWSRGESTVAALTVAGAPNDVTAVPALVASGRLTGTRVAPIDVDGRSGLSVVMGDRRRAVIARTGWGDVLVVVANGPEPLPTTTLVELAASARPVDEARWDELRVAAEGGPGLHADPGAVELARGTVDGRGWLLQARPRVVRWRDGRFRTSPVPDECLKLSTFRRACATAGVEGASERVNIPVNDGDLLPDDFPPFVFVVTESDAARVRVEQGDTVGEAEVHRPRPGQTGGAVVFVDVSIWSTVCDSPTSATEHTAEVELLDAAGQRIRCLGA